MDLKLLKEPFKAEDIEWRVQSSGLKKDGTPWAKVLAYVTNRAIMDRLDEVCGPENWRNEYKDAPGGGILCGISIRLDIYETPIPEDARCEDCDKHKLEWITKWDGAEQTNIEKVKGGLSAAMKRAAVQWGIGRYLYNLKAEWAVVNMTNGSHFDIIKDQNKKKIGEIRWDPPKLPAWALPEGENTEPDKQKDKTIQYSEANKCNAVWAQLSEKSQAVLGEFTIGKRMSIIKENDYDAGKVDIVCTEILEERR